VEARIVRTAGAADRAERIGQQNIADAECAEHGDPAIRRRRGGRGRRPGALVVTAALAGEIEDDLVAVAIIRPLHLREVHLLSEIATLHRGDHAAVVAIFRKRIAADHRQRLSA
jgi:hypothetical protein